MAESPHLSALSNIEITAPFVVLAGGNGIGKSSLLQMLRCATGLVGSGLGRALDHDRDAPIQLPSTDFLLKDPGPADLGRLAFQRVPWEAQFNYWSKREGVSPSDEPGVLDIKALGWSGQQIFLHDSRDIDGEGLRRGGTEDMIGSMRRASARDALSHGQAIAARLNYAVAWGLGLFKLQDRYDQPPLGEQDRRFSERRGEKWDRVICHIFEKCAGHPPGSPDRNPERWLLLDEPEVGLSPTALVKAIAPLVEKAQKGELQVICASQHPLLTQTLARHPKVQVIDLDGAAEAYRAAAAVFNDPALLTLQAQQASGHLSQAVTAAEAYDAANTEAIAQWRFHRRRTLALTAMEAPIADS